jgi:hypothetical protein
MNPKEKAEYLMEKRGYETPFVPNPVTKTGLDAYVTEVCSGVRVV